MSVLSGAEISETYPATNFRRSTGSPAATPASHSVTPGSEWEKTTLVICGQRSSTSCELFDPEESSSRTSPGTCRSASIASFKTWRDAVTAVRSDCLRRRKSARRTDASGSSFSVWPTATGIHAIRGNHDEPLEKYMARVRDYEEGRAKGKPGKSLGVAVRLWPTVSFTVGGSSSGLDAPDNPSTKASRPAQLNPDWVDLLMGFPIGWTDCGLSGTR